MITVNGRLVAVLVVLTAGTALVALGVTSAVSNRVTGHEALAGLVAFLTGLAAALWLRRDRLRGRRP